MTSVVWSETPTLDDVERTGSALDKQQIEHLRAYRRDGRLHPSVLVARKLRESPGQAYERELVEARKFWADLRDHPERVAPGLVARQGPPTEAQRRDGLAGYLCSANEGLSQLGARLISFTDVLVGPDAS